MSEERKNIAKELHRVRNEQPGGHEGEEEPTRPARRPWRPPEALPRDDPGAPGPPPDATGVSEARRVAPVTPRGWRGVVFRALDRLMGPRFEAQQSFNTRQVELDNAILKHIEERSAGTHRHYDRILGIYRRHLEEIEERYGVLEEDLAAHVEDLVRRIDRILSDGEGARLSLDHELRDLRRRIEVLPDALKRDA